MNQETGGPAFPSHGSMGEVVQEGMTLRDRFAIRALPTAIEHWKNCDVDEEEGGRFEWDDYIDGKDTYSADCLHAAEWAYHMADAMLAARKTA